jgi:hypothetical protein
MDFYKVNRQVVGHMINLFVGLAELLLLMRVFMKFFFTTAGGGFVHWAFSTTDVLLTPFRGVFPNPTHTPGTWYVDWVALFAMAVYVAAGYLLVSLAARWTPVGRK